MTTLTRENRFAFEITLRCQSDGVPGIPENPSRPAPESSVSQAEWLAAQSFPLSPWALSCNIFLIFLPFSAPLCIFLPMFWDPLTQVV